jgi:uncharacterized cupin superfamily protein
VDSVDGVWLVDRETRCLVMGESDRDDEIRYPVHETKYLAD